MTAPAARPRALVADDGAEVRARVERVLGLHFDVHAVESGASALKIALEQRPDLLVAKLSMVEPDGSRLIAAVRKEPRTQRLPVLLLSAAEDEDAAAGWLAAGAVDYLVAPFSDRALVARADAAIAAARAYSEVDAERQKQHALFAQAPTAIAIIEGQELRFTFANPAYRALLNGREVVGKTLDDALPDIRGQGFDALLHQVMASGEPYFATELPVKLAHHRDGERLHVNFSYTPMRSGSGTVVGVLVSASDVTEQVLARQRVEMLLRELEASNERLRLVVAAADVGTWELDLLTERLIANDAFRAMFEVAPEEAFNLTNGLATIHPEDSPRVSKTVADAIAGKDEGRYRIDYRITRANGGPPRWIEARGQALFGSDGRAARFLGTGIDISWRKQAEQEREELLRLEKEARSEAEEASRLKDEFLATVSHELRTPLNAMLGWVQMLRAGTVPPDQQKRALETVERNARAQVQLIEDLLDMSRILAGKLRLEIESLDIAPVVEAALESIGPAAAAKGIRLQRALDTTGAVMGDPNRLQQIVWNILSNAVKFTPKGGRIQVVLQRIESAVELTVADTGQGIANEFLPHVFERFRQADGGIARAKGGLGLGLSIVHQLVEMQGGTITVASSGEGQGTVFTVRLPLAITSRREEKPESTPPTGAARVLDGVRVLVLDDEEDAREMLGVLLEMNGATVVQAGSPHEARTLFAAEPFDVVVSDVGMPGESGHDFIASIRELPAAQGGNVPAVALTAYARIEDRTKSLNSGFTNHLTKPVDPAELVAAVAALARPTRALK